MIGHFMRPGNSRYFEVMWKYKMPEENIRITIPTSSHSFFTLLLKNIMATGSFFVF